MAKKAAKKTPKKKRLGMVGGVNEKSLQRVTAQIRNVEHSITQIVEGMKSTRDKGVKASKRLLLGIRKKQLKNLMKELRTVTK